MSTTWRMSAELLGSAFHADSDGPAQELPPPATKAEASTSGQSEVPTDKIRLPKGMAVRLFLIEPISIRTAKAGDPVRLQVLGPVKADNLVVIANKAPASGTITEVYKSGQEVAMDWHAGGLRLQLDSVMLIDQQKQPLQAQDAPKEAPTNAAVEWARPVFPNEGGTRLLLALNEVTLPRGAVFTAVTSGDTLLDVSAVEAAQPAPVVRKHGEAWVSVCYPNVWWGPSFAL